jgi:WD40 repeat protein
MKCCPSPDRLRQLLADQLGGAERASLEAHIEGCLACQESLATLTDEGGAATPPLPAPVAAPESDAGFVRRLGEQPPPCQEAASAPEEPPEPIAFPEPPTDKGPLGRLDGLHMRKELGRGRFGVVYEAVDELDRVVAVKVLKPQLAADPRERTRFEEEARKAAAVRHESIITVHQVGHAPGLGLPYLVMEYLEGETLAERLRRAGALPPREAAEVVRQVALGLMAAHARGLMHRDVKPSNILLERGSGRAKITDFGLARDTAAGALASQSAAVVGTPAYMSPEQITTPGKVDLRSDLYCLGVVLYEALTAERPFRGVAHVVLDQVVHDEPRPPRKLNDAVPRDLETITLKCLAKEPGRRYQSAGELAEDLQRWQEGRPIQARPVGRVEKVWRWCRRNPGLAGSLAAASLFLVVGSFVSSLLAVRARDEARRADAEATGARARHYASEMKLASLDWEAGRVGLVQERLREQFPDPGVPDLRGFEWYYLQRLCQLQLRTLQGHIGEVQHVAFSPDGKYLASAGGDRTVKLWDVATSQAIRTLEGHTDTVLRVAFSPDGKHLASASGDRTVKVWDTATGQHIRTLRGHPASVNAIAFSPDGNLASASDRTVIVWEATTGQQTLIFQGHTGAVRGLAFSPDGKHLASASQDHTVEVWDAATGNKLLTLRGHTGAVFDVKFSPGGKRLASASDDLTVRVWDADTGRQTLALKGHLGHVYRVAFSPDGRRIASAGQDQTVRVWDAATGQEALVLREHTHRVYGVAFSPDGRRIASAGWDGTVRVWDAALRQPTLTLQGHAALYGMAFSHDARRLASASQDGTVKIWDTTGRDIVTLQGHTGWVRGVAFSPDDHLLVSASEDRTVRIWDGATGRQLRSLLGHTGPVLAVAFSPEGRWIASVSPESNDGTVRFYMPVFSPDGKHLAFPSEDATLKVWDAATGQHIFTCQGHRDRVLTVAFSPDGKHLASGGNDQMVKLWDAATGKAIRSFQTHSGAILSVAFSPDGRRLASTGGDATVRLWDTATGQEILTLQGHTRAVFAVAFSSDGRRLASASLDGTVKVWDATELTPQAHIDWEARGLVGWLFAKPLPPEEVAAAVHRDSTITEAVRQQALDWVERLDRIQVRADAARLVVPLFAKALPRSDILQVIQGNTKLSDPLRQQALSLAERYPQNAETLFSASVAVTSRMGAELAKYQLALRQAQAAYELFPDDAVYVHAFGVAQYHVGKYEMAVEKLTLAEKLGGKRFESFCPCSLKFLALAHHHLAQNEQAQATLERLRELMKKPEWVTNSPAQRHLREAEEGLKTKPADGKGP